MQQLGEGRGSELLLLVVGMVHQAIGVGEQPPAELLGVAPVFADERARGKPVYFCDVIVRRDSPARSFWDLKGGTWAYIDPCSLSGHGGLGARLSSPGRG